MSGYLIYGVSYQTSRCLPAGDRVRVCIAILRDLGALLSASWFLNGIYLRSLFIDIFQTANITESSIPVTPRYGGRMSV